MYKCQNTRIKNQDWGYMCVFLFKRVCFSGSPRKIFILSPAGFVISPMRNLLLGLSPENCLKFEIFPGESSSPHRDVF